MANPNNITPLESLSTDEENIDWVKTENVAAIIKGDVYPDEYIILTAHLDHVGIEDGEIYNGADDDGSGSMALLEIAQAFKLAELDLSLIHISEPTRPY